MAIQVSALLDRAKRTLGGGGPSFDVLFLDAINAVITDYNRQANREVDYLESSSGEIDVSLKHWRTFFLGVIHYLQVSGEWSREPDTSAEARYQRALAMSQFEEVTEDDPDAGIPEGTWGTATAAGTDIDPVTGNVIGG